MRYRVTSTIEIEVRDDTPRIAGASWRRNKRDGWEPQGIADLRLFLSVLYRRSARHVIDVGANAGTWAIAIAALPGVETVTAFEPVPAVYDLLVENCRMSPHREKIKCVRAAVGEHQSTVPFLVATNAAYSHAGDRMLRTHLGPIGTTRVDVEMVRLDECDWLWKHELDAIKIDVEGGELQVVCGAMDLIRSNRPLIHYEEQKTNLKQYGNTPGAVRKLLAPLDYEFKSVGTCDVLATPHVRRG